MNLDKINAATAHTAPRSSGIEQWNELEISRIYPNPYQPRKHFDPVALAELAESIRKHGLLQPILVARRADGYMIVAGERRYRAHLLIEATTIRANIDEEYTDTDIDEKALIENIQREDLSDFEITKAIEKLWNSGKYEKKQDLASAIGKPPSYVSKALSCLRLDDSIKTDIETNGRDIGITVMDEIARLDDPTDQRTAYDGYVSGTMTRNDVTAMAKKEPKPREISPGEKHTDGYVFKELALICSGTALMNIVPYPQNIDPNKRYKITIEEA